MIIRTSEFFQIIYLFGEWQIFLMKNQKKKTTNNNKKKLTSNKKNRLTFFMDSGKSFLFSSFSMWKCNQYIWCLISYGTEQFMLQNMQLNGVVIIELFVCCNSYHVCCELVAIGLHVLLFSFTAPSHDVIIFRPMHRQR